MAATDAGRFTVGVFADLPSAEKGIAALLRAGLLAESIGILATASDGASALIERVLGVAPQRLRAGVLGETHVAGPIVRALQGDTGDFERLGLAGSMRRLGYLPHDARIFEALTARGGVLVAVHSEPRAADALAVFHAYGGGNAAIGAWTGRV